MLHGESNVYFTYLYVMLCNGLSEIMLITCQLQVFYGTQLVNFGEWYHNVLNFVYGTEQSALSW